MKKQTIHDIFSRWQEANPKPATELVYHNDFQLLIAVLLSAQMTDTGVNKATKILFQIAKTPQDMLDLGELELLQHTKSVNLYKTKTKHLLKTCEMLVEQHQGQIPNNRKDLEALPGVGRKTANVVLNVAFGEPTMAVDTHIFRLGNRLGLAPGKTPLDVEKKLLKVIPKEFKVDAHHWLILHGRYICTARKPKCSECLIADLCEYKDKV